MVDDIKFDLDEAKRVFYELKAKRAMTEEYLERARVLLALNQVTLLNTEKARVVVQKVANELQAGLELRITSMVTMALSAIFDDPYEFKAEFVTRRNQTECDMFFLKNGNECDPMEASGGGAKDIASLALRMAIWSIKKTRAIQLLDEPARFLSRDMQSKCSELLKELSDKLGIQLIIVSHVPEMIESADRVFVVEQTNDISKVKTI